MRMWKRSGLAVMVLLAASLMPQAVLALEGQAERPKIGLALSGGGARGLAHIGVLKVLERHGIRPDFIAGTSMGAIVGGLYAMGFSADEIEDIVRETNWSEAFVDASSRRYQSMRQKALEQNFLIHGRVGFNRGEVQLPLGVLQGQRLQQLLNRITLPAIEVSDFDRLDIPFRALATDLVTGDEVILAHGSLVEAMRASMSIPGVFAPVERGDMLLADGGMANNLPVSVVQSMGADRVIAVDVSMPLYPRELLDSVLAISEQITTFLTRNNTDRQRALLDEDDLLIVPNLTQVGSASFDMANHSINVGMSAAELALVEAGNLLFDGLLSEGDRSPVSRHALQHAGASLPVDFIELDNQSNLSDDILLSRLNIQLGQALDLEQLERDLQVLYGLEAFEQVVWEPVVQEGGRRGIRITAIPNRWGPNYLQFGLQLSDDFSGNNEFTLGAAYTRTGMNRLGGELRTEANIGSRSGLKLDFYQPLDQRARFFFNPVLAYRKRELNVFDDNRQVAELNLRGAGIQLGVGRNFGTTGQLRLDLERFEGDVDVSTGVLNINNDSFSIGEITLSGVHDTLDDIDFPREGHQWTFGARFARDALGSERDFEQAFGGLSQAWTFGRHTLLWQAEGGYSFDDGAPIERVFELGGFGRLSGLVPDQLNGQHYAVAGLAYYRRLGNIDFLPAYAGLSLEAGNVWQRSNDISFSGLRKAGSLFVGADTPLGPVYLAYGRIDGGEGTLYLFLGNPFVRNSTARP